MDYTPSCICHGETDASQPGNLIADNKHILVLVDGDGEHRHQIKAALMSFYHVVEFDHGGPAMEFLQQTHPGMVIIGENVKPHGGLEFTNRISQDPALASIATLLILEAAHPNKEAAAKHCGAKDWLGKPYRRSALIRKISRQLNAAVEKRWESLPVIQAEALKGTVEIFNNLSDVIDKGEPIVYNDVNRACTPLIEAVNSNNYKGILSNVKDHDNYTYAHSLRVAIFLSLFGRAIGLPVEDQKQLATGGLLHDVGKMLIPHSVLNKPGKLTRDEFEIMKGHVNASISILERGDVPHGVIIIAAQHHEKLDGTGYPNRLVGEELNKLARMASIVDVFSALTDRRVYKAPMSPEKALGIMVNDMSTHLDIALLNRFREMLLDAAVDITATDAH